MFGGGIDWGMGGGLGGGGIAGFSVGNLIQEVGVYERNASSVREYAYSEDKNYKFRPAMEDSKGENDNGNSLCNQG